MSDSANIITLQKLMKKPSETRTRGIARIYRNHEQPPDDRGYMPGTIAERLTYMWQVTQDAWAFAPGTAHANQSEVQRDVTTLIKTMELDFCWDVCKLEGPQEKQKQKKKATGNRKKGPRLKR